MATANVVFIPPLPVKPIRRVELSLSPQEAIALIIVLASIGGSRDITARGYTETVYIALRDALGVESVPSDEIFLKNAESLYFGPNSLTVIDRKMEQFENA